MPRDVYFCYFHSLFSLCILFLTAKLWQTISFSCYHDGCKFYMFLTWGPSYVTTILTLTKNVLFLLCYARSIFFWALMPSCLLFACTKSTIVTRFSLRLQFWWLKFSLTLCCLKPFQLVVTISLCEYLTVWLFISHSKQKLSIMSFHVCLAIEQNVQVAQRFSRHTKYCTALIIHSYFFSIFNKLCLKKTLFAYNAFIIDL